MTRVGTKIRAAMSPTRASVIAAMAFAAVAVAAGVAPLDAQTPVRDQRDQRDQTRKPASPTGELPVAVVSDDQEGRPIRRVSVALQSSELDVPHILVTDDNGRVVFRNLEPGNYLLTAIRAGYVRTFYGSSWPGRGPGAPVHVVEGKPTSEVRIRMLRGGVISGTVRGVTGRPAPNVQVQTTMVRQSGGVRQAVNLEAGLGAATTDDRGVYRIFGLAPGEYLVSVPSIGPLSEEVRPMTAEELRWADTAVATGASPGSAGATPAPAAAARVMYSPVYFPGTTRVANATVITLGPQEERLGTDFALTLVPTAEITGRVIDAAGQPQPGVAVTIRPQQPDGMDLFAGLFNTSAMTTSDGTFTIPAVKPGEYTLMARATPKGAAPPPKPDPIAEAQARLAGVMGGPSTTHFAVENVNVNGVAISNLTLELRPGMTISGRIVYEATKLAPPSDLSKTMLAFAPVPTGNGMEAMLAGLMGTGGSTTPTVAADGTFTIRGVPPGEYRLNTPFAMMPMFGAQMPAPGGWALKSAMAGGRDIADAGLQVRAGADVSGVVVTFTDRPAELSGRVTDGAGRPAPGFPIIVFSTDRAYWTLGSRRVQTARPSSDGTYTIVGIPAGEYFVCAVTAVDRTEQYDPAFLDQLVPASFKITIADGEKKTQDLKLGGG